MNKAIRLVMMQLALVSLTSCAVPAASPSTVTQPVSAATPPPYVINTTTLASYSGVHPKLYVDNARLSQLQGYFANPPAGTRWTFLKNTFNSKVNGYQSKSPEPAGYDNGDLSEGWQEINGQAMFNDAVAYRLTNNIAYL